MLDYDEGAGQGKPLGDHQPGDQGQGAELQAMAGGWCLGDEVNAPAPASERKESNNEQS